MSRGPVGVAVAALATRQHGVVAVSQLRALGLRDHAIQHRIAVGNLHPLHRGVYAVGHTRLERHGRWIAAVLACGQGALLSHRSAAALWGLIRADGIHADVSVADRRGRTVPRIERHRPRSLQPQDRTERNGIPVTSVARTLLDLAMVIHEEGLRRAFEEADRLHILQLAAIEELLERSVGHHGRRRLRRLVAFAAPPPEVRSELERRFLRLCDEAGLARPVSNVLVEGHEVDAVWRGQRVVVELDGFAYHRSRAAFERDRRRDAELQLAGWRVLRLTAHRLDHEPQAVAQTIRAMLADESGGGRADDPRGGWAS